MRFDNVKGGEVCSFICGGSACDETCCMQQVLGRCYSMREELLRVVKWRIEHGERTMQEAKDIGLRFGAEVV